MKRETKKDKGGKRKRKLKRRGEMDIVGTQESAKE
jgi:hypothetical protein